MIYYIIVIFCLTAILYLLYSNNQQKQITKVIIKKDDDLLTQYDYGVIYNPLIPPQKRPERNLLPFYSRGLPDNYRYIGNLTRSTDKNILQLFGRQMFPGSTQYEYYAIDKDGIKVDVDTLHDKELFTGDEIDIPLFDTSLGKFKVYLHDTSSYKYVPYIY